MPNFSKKPAKKFISSYFLVSQTRGALIHFLIPNWSEYAPDSLGARGVANPGASFFDREANFFAPKMRPDVRTKCARFHHETAKAPGVANQAKRATPAACQRVDCGITKNLPHSQTSDTLYNALSLTRSTIPPPHHKSVPAASPQTEKFPRSSQPSAPAQPPIHPSS